LELARETFQCFCNFLTAIFGTILYAVGANPDLIASANPCCVYQKIFLAAVEAVRLLAQLIVAFSDLNGQGGCYLYNRPDCQGGNYSHTFATLPIYIQYERVIGHLFTQRGAIPPPGSCAVNVSPDANRTAIEGLPTCYCNLANAILATSFKVAENVFNVNITFGNHSADQKNYCYMDICSPIFSAGLVIQEVLKVAGQVAIGLIQDWEQRCVLIDNVAQLRPRQEIPPNAKPYFCAYMPVQLLDAFFCDEYGAVNVLQNFNPITNPQTLFPNEAPLPTCIKIEPVFEALNFFFNSSLCIQGVNSGVGNGIINVLDRFLEWFTAWISYDVFSPILFPISVIWPKCLCSGGPNFMGFVRPTGTLIVTTLRQALVIIRNFGDPTFWAPASGSFSVPSSTQSTGLASNNVNTFRRSWIVRGLGPIADAFCDAVTNAACILAMILGDVCEAPRYTIVSSLFRYAFEAIFRIIAIVEAFAKLIAKQVSGGCITLEDENGRISTICQPGTGYNHASNTIAGGLRLLNRPLGELIVATTTFLVDATIGIGRLGCTSMCDGGFQADNTIRFKPSKNPCDCYNLSPYIYSELRVECDAEVMCTGTPIQVLGNFNGNFRATYLDPCDLDTFGVWIPNNVVEYVDIVDYWELWTNGQIDLKYGNGPSEYINVTKSFIPLVKYSQWATEWNASSPGIAAYVKFAKFNFRSCNIFVTNLTDPVTGIRVPFIENNPTPVGWAPNSQGFFGTQNTQSIGSKCPLFPTDGYRSYEQIQAMERARGYEYNLNSPDFDMLRYCSLGGQSYYSLPGTVAGIANPYPYWPTLQNTPSCMSNTVSVGQGREVPDVLTLNIETLCVKPNTRTQCEQFQQLFATPFNFTRTPTLAQLAARRAFIKYILSSDDISHMPGGEITTDQSYKSIPLTSSAPSFFSSSSAVCASLTAGGGGTGGTVFGNIAACSPQSSVRPSHLIGSTWSALTVNYHRIHGQVYYIETADGITSGMLRVNDSFFLGVNKFEELRGYQLNTDPMTNGAPMGKFAFTPQTDGDNSFLRAHWNRNPYIMLPLCRRDEDAPPSPKYGLQYTPGTNPFYGAAVKYYPSNTVNWTYANGQTGFVTNYTYAPEETNTTFIGMTQYQMFKKTSFSCVEGKICKNDQNVPCSPGMPIVLDGAVRSALLYLKCLAQRIVPELASVISLLLKILAWIWQVSAGIIKFLVALLILGLDIIFIFAGFGGCDVCTIASEIFNAIADVVTAFIEIFQQRVILTDAKKRGDTIVDDADILQASSTAINTFFKPSVDTAACIDNPLPCFCKLVDMPNSCVFNESDGNLSPQGLTTADITMYLGIHFTGVSMCDLLIQNNTAQEWSSLSRGERYLYVDCVSKRVLGETINKQLPLVPVDSFYTLDAIPRMFQSAIDHTLTSLNRKRKEFDDFEQARLESHHRRQEKQKRDQQASDNEWTRMMREEPEKYDAFVSRQRQMASRILIKDKIMNKNNFLFQSVLDASDIWTKYQTGYYYFLASGVGTSIARNGWYGSIVGKGDVTQSSKNVVQSAKDLMKQFPGLDEWNDMQHLSFEALDGIGKAFRDLISVNVSSFSFHPRGPLTRANVSIVPSAVFKSVSRHLQTTVSHWNFNLPSMSIFNIMPTEFTFKANWSPKNLHAVESLRRIGYRVVNSLWPHHLTEHDHKRYIVEGNCSYYDGAVNLALMQVDYCLNKFNLSIPPIVTKNGGLSDYLEQTSPLRPGGFFNRYDKTRYVWTNGGRISMINKPPSTKPRRSVVDTKIYRRAATSATDTTPPAFNWLAWLVERIEDLLGIDIAQTTTSWTEDIEAWFENDNVMESDFPDVGFKYWIKFMFTCEFPENLNCGQGIGLEEALRIITPWFLIVILICFVVAPGLLGLIGGLALFLIYALVIAIVGWHYSPWCLFLTPSFVPRPGISIPLLPIPMSFWALPECMIDDIIGLLDKFISNCPAFLEDLAYAIIGPTCPACPEKIAWISCKEVGIYDGFSNWMYFFYHFLSPRAFEIIVGILQATFFYVIPGASEYMANLLRSFQTTSPTEQEQQLFCFWLTILSMAWPILAILLIGSLLALLIIPLLWFLGSVWRIIVSTPIYDAITGRRVGWFEIPSGDQPPDDNDGDIILQEEAPIPPPVKAAAVPYTPVFVQRISRMVRTQFGYPKQKKE
jgi:hypothetical protein